MRRGGGGEGRSHLREGPRPVLRISERALYSALVFSAMDEGRGGEGFGFSGIACVVLTTPPFRYGPAPPPPLRAASLAPPPPQTKQYNSAFGYGRPPGFRPS